MMNWFSEMKIPMRHDSFIQIKDFSSAIDTKYVWTTIFHLSNKLL